MKIKIIIIAIAIFSLGFIIGYEVSKNEYYGHFKAAINTMNMYDTLKLRKEFHALALERDSLLYEIEFRNK